MAVAPANPSASRRARAWSTSASRGLRLGALTVIMSVDDGGMLHGLRLDGGSLGPDAEPLSGGEGRNKRSRRSLATAESPVEIVLGFLLRGTGSCACGSRRRDRGRLPPQCGEAPVLGTRGGAS